VSPESESPALPITDATNRSSAARKKAGEALLEAFLKRTRPNEAETPHKDGSNRSKSKRLPHQKRLDHPSIKHCAVISRCRGL
jgi:hypothetical protein